MTVPRFFSSTEYAALNTSWQSRKTTDRGRARVLARPRSLVGLPHRPVQWFLAVADLQLLPLGPAV